MLDLLLTLKKKVSEALLKVLFISKIQQSKEKAKLTRTILGKL
jgi:hypothetical protein